MRTCILGDMADTSVRISAETRDRFKALADSRGKSLASYLDELSQQAENQERLGQATAFFDAALDPETVEAFDAHYGGLPAGARASHRAA